MSELVPAHDPWLGAAETNESPEGSASVRTTPVVAFGPRFATVAVNVVVPPTATSAGLATRLVSRSAASSLTIVPLAVHFPPVQVTLPVVSLRSTTKNSFGSDTVSPTTGTVNCFADESVGPQLTTGLLDV